MSGEPQWKADAGSVTFLLGVRDNNLYTDDYRGIVAKHHGYGSWQALMDDGLADAEAPESTHCSECGRPSEPEEELPEPQETRRVAVKPGDILVVRYPGRLSREWLPRITEQIETVFGEGVRFVVMDQGGAIDVLEPPAAEAAVSPTAKARELGTGELGTWEPEFARAVDALRELNSWLAAGDGMCGE